MFSKCFSIKILEVSIFVQIILFTSNIHKLKASHNSLQVQSEIAPVWYSNWNSIILKFMTKKIICIDSLNNCNEIWSTTFNF